MFGSKEGRMSNFASTFFKLAFLIISFFMLAHPLIALGNIYKLSYETDLSLAGIGLASQIGSYFLGKHQDSLTRNEIQSLSRSDVNRFDRSATYNWSATSDKWSNYTVYALIACPAFLLAGDEPRSDAPVLGIMYIESIVIESGLTGVVKSAVGRKRPYVYNPDVPPEKKTGKDAVRSFYSGHTATAFNSAVFLSIVFSDYYPESILRYFVWSGSLLLASATGYLRYRAGKHYPTDIIAGAAIGSLSGYMVPALHRTKEWKWSLCPHTDSESSGFIFIYKF
jgi:membrane-associated phospholipid phosphatase